MTVVLRARSPIRAGEQVTISYICHRLMREQRREELKRRYKFDCRCKACDQSPLDVSKSDFRRITLVLHLTTNRPAVDEAAFEKWLADGAPARDTPMPVIGPHIRNHQHMLQEIDRLDGFTRMKFMYGLMETEDLFPSEYFELVLARLVKGYSVLENEQEVRKYALMAARLKMAYTGSDGGWSAVVQHPRETDWWAKRLKRTM